MQLAEETASFAPNLIASQTGPVKDFDGPARGLTDKAAAKHIARQNRARNNRRPDSDSNRYSFAPGLGQSAGSNGAVLQSLSAAGLTLASQGGHGGQIGAEGMHAGQHASDIQSDSSDEVS